MRCCSAGQRARRDRAAPVSLMLLLFSHQRQSSSPPPCFLPPPPLSHALLPPIAHSMASSSSSSERKVSPIAPSTHVVAVSSPPDPLLTSCARRLPLAIPRSLSRRPSCHNESQRVLVTGGAGYIGQSSLSVTQHARSFHLTLPTRLARSLL